MCVCCGCAHEGDKRVKSFNAKSRDFMPDTHSLALSAVTDVTVAVVVVVVVVDLAMRATLSFVCRGFLCVRLLCVVRLRLNTRLKQWNDNVFLKNFHGASVRDVGLQHIKTFVQNFGGARQMHVCSYKY